METGIAQSLLGQWSTIAGNHLGSYLITTTMGQNGVAGKTLAITGVI